MIPKKIHYCWFGKNDFPIIVRKCIQSWQKFFPDYEIKEWNESNFDIDSFPYVREAYHHGKYAFVSDVVRLYALYTEGGIYLDTDVEIIKSIDPLLMHKAVCGFESNNTIQTGFIASVASLPIFKQLLDEYYYIHFINDGEMDLTTNVVRLGTIFNQKGLILNNTLQTIEDVTFFPKDYFNPIDKIGYELNLTKNTYCIHHFSGSWMSKWERQKKFLTRFLGPRITKIIISFKHKFLLINK